MGDGLFTEFPRSPLCGEPTLHGTRRNADRCEVNFALLTRLGLSPPQEEEEEEEGKSLAHLLRETAEEVEKSQEALASFVADNMDGVNSLSLSLSPGSHARAHACKSCSRSLH